MSTCDIHAYMRKRVGQLDPLSPRSYKYRLLTRLELLVTDHRIPVTLLTGFLGSGKTTVLNHLLRTPGMEGTAVVVNEFGDVGIDHELFVGSGETIVLLQNGCLCCAIRTDLVETLHDMLEQHLIGDVARLDRVVIETTGLADPTPVFHTLMTDQVLVSQFRLDAIVTVIDAAAGIETLDTQPEAVKQLAIADRVILTKTDLVEVERAQRTRERISTINPAAPILIADHGKVDINEITNIVAFDTATRSEAISEWLNDGAYDSNAGHNADVNSACLVLDKPLSLGTLDTWLDALTAQQGPDLLRMKGLINVEGKKGPLLVHGVQHVFHPPRELPEWPSDDRRSRIVLISRKLEQAQLQASLDFLKSTAVAGGTGPLTQALQRKKLLPGLGG